MNANFLIAFCRQLRQALDEGTELAYEFGELCLEATDLVGGDSGPAEEDGTDDGADGGQVELSHISPRSEGRERPSGALDGPEQGNQPDVAGLVRGNEHVPDGYNRPGGVPRGTGSGASAAMMLEKTVRRVPDGTW